MIQAAIEYRTIPGFPWYIAGTDGSIWTRRSSYGRIDESRFVRVKCDLKSTGYVNAILRDEHGKRLCPRVHRLILLTFVGPCPPGMECCHNDGSRSNNALSNLRWDTRSSNAQDRVRHGRHNLKGSRCGAAKMNEAQILEMRQLLAQGVSTRKLAKRFGISQTQVVTIKNRRAWNWLEKNPNDK